MRYMTVDQLRQSFLHFFQNKEHRCLPSASLVPHNDPTLLLTAAGMVPFKPYFLGREEPPTRRITTCQRCLRTADIENVGITDRHGTFFEMLGNFSFGDYFKQEAINWAWEYVTKVLEVDPQHLWITIYLDDDDAFRIWHEEVGVPKERIVRLGKEDNFWGIGVGPCGPCSEIHIDRGPEHGCGDANCKPGCDCERFMEIWNLVFVQYHQDEEGQLHPLEHPGIDTGMGLERIAALLQNKKSIFEIDSIYPVVDFIAKRAGFTYGQDQRADVSLRVVADHMRGAILMIFDGILPGNEGRGYVLRRLLRRAVRHARLLGIHGSFLSDVVDQIIILLEPGYPELVSKSAYIHKVVQTEEQRFQETLDQGMAILEKVMQAAEHKKVGITGEDAFRLYDTYGFPLELTEEIAADRGLSVDKAGFAAAMELQRQRARAARVEQGYMGDEQDGISDIDLPATEFTGYSRLVDEAKVLAILTHGEQVGMLNGQGVADIVLSRTPFYAEGGGQVADSGEIKGSDIRFHIKKVFRANRGVVVHKGTYDGNLQVGQSVEALVDKTARQGTQQNHTATHILHKALHEVIGEHANQAGSLVAPDRFRFDFTHFEAVSAADIAEIERRVNEIIWRNLPVSAQELSYDAAINAGAMALFGEKYGDKVRMVSVGDVSRELCGGTHVESTGEIGLFRIVSEGSIASGVRRIEALTGQRAWDHIKNETETLADAAMRLQVTPKEILVQIEKLQAQLKQYEREIETLKARLAGTQIDDLLAEVQEVNGIKILAAAVDDLDRAGLLSLADKLKEQLGAYAFAIAGVADGKVHLLVTASPEAVDRGIDAAKIIRAVYGSGGGKPQMAQAGGKDPSGINEVMVKFSQVFVEQLERQTVNSR
jgi:alanyl-tRNA synthetase